jgi:hypothetical protein
MGRGPKRRLGFRPAASLGGDTGRVVSFFFLLPVLFTGINYLCGPALFLLLVG